MAVFMARLRAAERIALAVDAGGVVRSAGTGHEQHLLLLRDLRHRDDLGAGDAARHHDRFVLRDEFGGVLNRRVGIGLGVGNLVLDLLTEHALFPAQAGNLAHHAGAGVEVLDRQQVAFAQILAVGTVGSGQRAAEPEKDRVGGGSGLQIGGAGSKSRNGPGRRPEKAVTIERHRLGSPYALVMREAASVGFENILFWLPMVITGAMRSAVNVVA